MRKTILLSCWQNLNKMELQGKWKLDIPNKEVENGLKTLLEWYTPVFSSETGTISEFAVRD